MFNYFIPGATKQQVAPGDKIDRAFLDGLGLGETLADVERLPADGTVTDFRAAPDRGEGELTKGGVLIAPNKKDYTGPLVLLDPNLQAWRRAQNGKYWLGHLKASRLEPVHLERNELVGGQGIFDLAGNQWTAPIARAPNHPYGALPQSYVFDAAGQPVPQLLPRFQWLWDLAGEIQDWYRLATGKSEEVTEAEQAEQRAKELPFTRLVQYAARILAVNYRVGLDELNALDAAGHPVMTNIFVNAICRASFGWEIVTEAKKKPPESGLSPAENSSSSTTGGEEGAAGTGPVEGP